MKAIIPIFFLAVFGCMAQDWSTPWTWDVDTKYSSIPVQQRNVAHGESLRIEPRVLDNGVARVWPTNATFIMKYQVNSMISSNLWWTNSNARAHSETGRIACVWNPYANNFYATPISYYCWLGVYSNTTSMCKPVRFQMNMIVSPDWVEGVATQLPIKYVLTDSSTESDPVFVAWTNGGFGGISVSGAVSSVYGRFGAVTAQTGDYTPAQVGAATGTPAGMVAAGALTGATLVAGTTLSIVEGNLQIPTNGWGSGTGGGVSEATATNIAGNVMATGTAAVATTAVTVTGAQSNLIASALQSQTTQVYTAQAGTAQVAIVAATVTGVQSNLIAAALTNAAAFATAAQGVAATNAQTVATNALAQAQAAQSTATTALTNGNAYALSQAQAATNAINAAFIAAKGGMTNNCFSVNGVVVGPGSNVTVSGGAGSGISNVVIQGVGYSTTGTVENFTGTVVVTAAQIGAMTNNQVLAAAQYPLALTNVPTLQQVVTADGIVTSGVVTIDAANERTNTYGGLLGIGPTRWQAAAGIASAAGSWANYDGTASGVGSWANNSATASGLGSWANVQATASGAGSWAMGLDAVASNNYSFSWRNQYSHGTGSFNIGAPSLLWLQNTNLQTLLDEKLGTTGSGASLTGITAAQVGAVPTNRTITINDTVGTLDSNLTFTVAGGGGGSGISNIVFAGINSKTGAVVNFTATVSVVAADLGSPTFAETTNIVDTMVPYYSVSASGVGVGLAANGETSGAAFGGVANATNEGAAVGGLSKGQVYGAALGRGANGSFDGVAVGYYSTGTNGGVAIGEGASGSGQGNVAIGGVVTGSGGATVPSTFQNTTEIGVGVAVSNGWFHYRGEPMFTTNALHASLLSHLVGTNDDRYLAALTNAAAFDAAGTAAGLVAGYSNVVSNAVAKALSAWQNPASATNWTWTSDGTQITLTSYNFSSLAVVIPDMLDGLPVTTINNFFNGSAITSVSGGRFVTILAQTSEFSGCAALTSVSLPYVTAIPSQAFFECISLTTVALPSAVSIGSAAFNGCTALTSVSLPSLVTLDNGVFSSCTTLTSVSLPSLVTSGGSTFDGCTALISVSFGKNAPAETTEFYLNAPNVTNYVTNPQATGWGATWNSRPVVRSPVYADEYWRLGTNLTTLLAAKQNTVAGTIVTNGGSGASLTGLTAAQVGAVSNTAAGIAAAGGLTNNHNGGLYVAADGKVGIGTTNPLVPLEINGHIRNASVSIAQGMTNFLYTGALSAPLDTADVVGIASFVEDQSNNRYGLWFFTQNAYNDPMSPKVKIGGNGNVWMGGDLAVAGSITASNGFYGSGASLTGLTAAQVGAVSNTAAGIAAAGGLTNNMFGGLYVATNGNVGIGTTNPLVKLQVDGAIGVSYGDGLRGLQASDAGFPYKYILRPYYGLDLLDSIGFHTAGYQSGAEHITIKSGGNVGIGTSTPAERLHVLGNAIIASNLTVTGNLIGGNVVTNGGSGASLTGITAAQVGAISNTDGRYLSALTNRQTNATLSGILTITTNGAYNGSIAFPVPAALVPGAFWSVGALAVPTDCLDNDNVLNNMYNCRWNQADYDAGGDGYERIVNGEHAAQMALESRWNRGLPSTTRGQAEWHWDVSPATNGPLSWCRPFHMAFGMDEPYYWYARFGSVETTNTYNRMEVLGAIHIGRPGYVGNRSNSKTIATGLQVVGEPGQAVDKPIAAFLCSTNTSSPNATEWGIYDDSTGEWILNASVSGSGVFSGNSSGMSGCPSGAVSNNAAGIAAAGGLTNNHNGGLYVAADGNVGIGTTNPTAKLSIEVGVLNPGETRSLQQWHAGYNIGSEVPSLDLMNSETTTNYAAMRFPLSNDGKDIDISFWNLGSSFSEKLRILGSGNVGIGTNTPAERLHVLGNAIIASNLTVTGNIIGGNVVTNGGSGASLTGITAAQVGAISNNVTGIANVGGATGAVFTSTGTQPSITDGLISIPTNALGGGSGTTGANGTNAYISITNVVTLAAGASAYASNNLVGTTNNVTLGIPQGAQGEAGGGVTFDQATNIVTNVLSGMRLSVMLTNSFTCTNSGDYTLSGLPSSVCYIDKIEAWLSNTNEGARSFRSSLQLFDSPARLAENMLHSEWTNRLWWAAPLTVASVVGATSNVIADASGVIPGYRYMITDGVNYEAKFCVSNSATTLYWGRANCSGPCSTNKFAWSANGTKISLINAVGQFVYASSDGTSNLYYSVAFNTVGTNTITKITKVRKFGN